MSTRLLFASVLALSTTSMIAEDEVLSREIIAASQQSLGRIGLYTGPVDGKIGPKTTQAIRQCQRQSGLPADGRISVEFLRNISLTGCSRTVNQPKEPLSPVEDSQAAPDWIIQCSKAMLSWFGIAVASVTTVTLAFILRLKKKLVVCFSNLKCGRPVFYCNTGDYEKAERLLRSALGNQFKTSVSSHSHYEKAERLFKNTLAIQNERLPSEHPDEAFILNNLALLYASQGQDNEAETCHRRALEICKAMERRAKQREREWRDTVAQLPPRVESEKGAVRDRS